MGRGRRHVPGRLRATPTRSSSPSSSPTTPTAQVPEYQTRLRHLREPAAASTTSTSRGGTTSTSTTSSKDYLPEPALYMIRYHSFYPGHREGAYDHLMNDHDREMFEWVRKFNPYDLYSKGHDKAGRRRPASRTTRI